MTTDYCDFLKTTVLFATLDDVSLSAVSLYLEKVSLSANQILFYAGDSDNSLYLIKQGRLKIVAEHNKHNPENLTTIKCPGESVGELAFLMGEKRLMRVCSVGNTELLCLTKVNFKVLSLKYSVACQKITWAMIRHFQQALVQKLLHNSNVFKNLDATVLADLENELDVSLLKGGNYLVREGDKSDSLHFIISGRLQVVTELNGKVQKVWTELGRGQSVGEMGIITKHKRSASVVALRDTLVAKMSQDSFYRLLCKHPQAITQQFSGGIVNRLWTQLQNPNRESNTLVTFTVVSANCDIALESFCINLVNSLAQFGATLHLSSVRLDDILGKTGAAQTPYEDAYNISLTQWLSEQETRHQFIVYQTDSTITDWSRRCLRQADRVLIVAHVQSASKLGKVANSLDRYCNKIDKTLILVHKPQTIAPSNSKLWLHKIKPSLHFHVRQQQKSDFNRLARVLTGNNICLVLSGGGARGLAHIGVIKALQEFGIKIDQIGGTSIGALIAAQYAMGWDAQTMLEKTKIAIKQHYKMEYTLPVVSLLSGQAWGNFLDAFFDCMQIEDLWLDYFCCSANLTNTQLNVHVHGSLWKAVRASSSIPGLIPPVYDDGCVLVDGAVLNNMPVDIIQKRSNGGLIIAVDVGGGINNSSEYFAPVQSGWKLALTRKKNKPDIPKIMSILMQSATMGSQMVQHTARKIANLYIQPEVNSYSILDFKSIECIAEAGYQSALTPIKLWLSQQNNTDKFSHTTPNS